MSSLSDVCVCIPTLNEGATIGRVIDEFYAEGVEHILVIDGNSSDDTREIAEEHGAEVILQSGSGKGQAVKQAVRHINQPYIVLVDGDDTYDPTHINRLVTPLKEGDAEHVIGNRFADVHDGALTTVNYFGNQVINTIFRVIHGVSYTDILTGYRAFTRESFLGHRLTSEGFGIETEMSVECVRQDTPVSVVPTSYYPRPDGSSTNLDPVGDGARIMYTMYRLSRTNNPLFYFGSLGTVSLIVGNFLTLYVLYDWVSNGVSHEVLAIGGAGAFLLGVQLFAFALLADMMKDMQDGLRTYIDSKVVDAGGRHQEPVTTPDTQEE